MRRVSIFGAAALFILLIFPAGDVACAYSSILAFGDSLSDNGTTALNGIPGDSYGFRRYSNGPVWVEYLAASRGLPLLDMAYGGATSAYDNPAAYSALHDPYYLGNTGLLWQLGQYASTHPAGIPQGTLVTVWAGGNDMFNQRSTLGAATNIGAAIQILYNLGGRHFIVPNLSISGPNDPYGAWKMTFDQQLAALLAQLRQLYPDLNLAALDLNGLVPDCDYLTGTWLAQTYGPGVYLSYDGVHPTTEMHEQIAAYANAAVPLPPTFYLLLSGLLGLAGYAKARFRR